MKITSATPGMEHIIALDAEDQVVGPLMEIDTEKMEGLQYGEDHVKPIKISKLIDGRTGQPWMPDEA